jgi:hypothetical protein
MTVFYVNFYLAFKTCTKIYSLVDQQLITFFLSLMGLSPNTCPALHDLSNLGVLEKLLKILCICVILIRLLYLYILWMRTID